MEEEIKKESLGFDGQDEIPQDVLKAMHEAGSYTGKELLRETRRKKNAKVARKKGLPPKPNTDLQRRKSKAQELQQSINRGENFMSNQNIGRNKEDKNVVGDAVQVDVTALLGDRESTVKQRTNLECTMNIGIGAAQKQMLESDYEMLSDSVRSFDIDTIPTKADFLAYCNTYGAVATARIVNNSWRVYCEVEGEQAIKYSYKDVKDQFKQPWIFSHAVNQFGRLSNNDLGITVVPVWVDFEQIGILEPSRIASVAQKVARLYSLNGIKVLDGVQAEPNANPEIMMSHEESASVNGWPVVQYRQFFRHVNMAEFLHCSRVRRDRMVVKHIAQPIPANESAEDKKLREDAEKRSIELEAKELNDRYLAAYICAYDMSFFTDKNRAVMLSAMKPE